VLGIRSGYRPSVLHTSSEPEVALHREFMAAFD